MCGPAFVLATDKPEWDSHAHESAETLLRIQIDALKPSITSLDFKTIMRDRYPSAQNVTQQNVSRFLRNAFAARTDYKSRASGKYIVYDRVVTELDKLRKEAAKLGFDLVKK